MMFLLFRKTSSHRTTNESFTSDISRARDTHAVRLVANCIIAYNSIILNSIYEKMLSEGATQDIIDKFARISPISWIHIAFTGKYNFKKNNGEIDMKNMLNALKKHLKRKQLRNRTLINPVG